MKLTTEDTENTERPTPETDAVKFRIADSSHFAVHVIYARRLERERDEAREAVAKWESSFDAMERAGAEQARRADENREWALRAERERDEARKEAEYYRERYEQLKEWKEELTSALVAKNMLYDAALEENGKKNNLRNQHYQRQK